MLLFRNTSGSVIKLLNFEGSSCSLQNAEATKD